MKNKRSDPVYDNQPILHDLTVSWLHDFKSQREKSTIEMYERVVRILEKSPVGSLKMSDLDRHSLQQLINENAAHPRTCQKIMLTYKQVIKYAISMHILPVYALYDLCEGISVPRYRPVERLPLSQEEKDAIRSARSKLDPRELSYLMILMGCGLRREEAIALTPSDISIARRTIRVNKAVGFYKGSPYSKGTKNGIERSVPMPPDTLSALQAYLPLIKGNHLFTDSEGGMLTVGTYRTLWNGITRKIYKEMPPGAEHKLTAHRFRHNYCTLLCYQIPTISVRKVASLLGDSEAMVMNVYNHILEEKEDLESVINVIAAEM